MNNHKNPRILELQNLSKYYRTGRSFFGTGGGRVRALDDVSLEIKKGEMFGLVGRSGSGKTTIGRLVLKLESCDTGRIVFLGSEISGLKGKPLKKFRKNMQMICQDPYQSLNPYFSIYDIVSEPLVIHSPDNKAVHYEQVKKMLSSVGLTPADEYMYRYPHQLSGGQKQKVAIARAMVLNPAFIVADEPTSMLDASVSMQIYSILHHLKISLGITFLFITHDIAAARLLCDRIAVIHEGKVVETGPCTDIIRNPESEYTRELIDALPGFVSGKWDQDA